MIQSEKAMHVARMENQVRPRLSAGCRLASACFWCSWTACLPRCQQVKDLRQKEAGRLRC